MDLSRIKKPTLILDEAKCRRNIRTMAEKAKSSNVIFRPHFKTHQSISIGEWFREEGIDSITVSSLTMARHFAGVGWKDITVAFPFNLREVDEAEKLANAINLNLLVSNQEQAGFLAERIKTETGFFIKIDTGYHRTGMEWNDYIQITRMLDLLNANRSLRFRGFLTHAGHTYKAASKAEMIDIYNDTLTKLSTLRSIQSSKYLLSTGDTPSCSIVESFKGFDEIRPGNFVFYDLMQFFLGSCGFDNISLAVACPVVEKNLRRKEIIIYGGGVHLSKEFLRKSTGQIVYGKAVLLNEDGWEYSEDDNYLKSLSQEHGVIEASDELCRKVNVGDLIAVIPVHSCMTADLSRKYLNFDDKIIDDFSPK